MNKRITKEDVATTETGKYLVNYTVEGNQLTELAVVVCASVMVDVPGPEGEPAQQEQLREVGRIMLQGNQVTTYNLPYNDKFAAWMSDFDAIVKEVSSPVPALAKSVRK